MARHTVDAHVSNYDGATPNKTEASVVYDNTKSSLYKPSGHSKASHGYNNNNNDDDD